MTSARFKIKLILDIVILFIITCIPLTVIISLGQDKVLSLTDGSPLLVKTAYTAFIQFSIAGLGAMIIMLIRKERFYQYGLKIDNIFISLISGAFLVLLFLLFAYLQQGQLHYLPFRQVTLTAKVLNAGFPTNIIGMTLIVLAWGFFEGFNYVYISKKINDLIFIKIPFLRPGPIIMGISCIFVHGAVGQDMAAILGSFFIIYFMLMIHELTGNSWGCILVFLFYWNAF
jgi:hypothetical protein